MKNTFLSVAFVLNATNMRDLRKRKAACCLVDPLTSQSAEAPYL